MDEKMDPWWAVTVKDSKGEIVTIERACLSGREITPTEEATIRKAASHLLGFIGEGYDPDARDALEASAAREMAEALEPLADAADYLASETEGFEDSEALTMAYRNEDGELIDIGAELTFGQIRKARAGRRRLGRVPAAGSAG